MSKSEDELILGIDLGTTNSCAAVMVDGQVHIVPDEQGAVLQASLISVLRDGTVVVGNEARKEAVTDPINTVFSAKRLIGRSFECNEVVKARKNVPYRIVKGPGNRALIELRGERYAIPELAGMLIRRMRDLAENYVGRPIKKVVITVPANFNCAQREETKLAGELAGMVVERIIHEPTAAALAYGYGRDVRARLVIYDFGGGTFDVTVLDVRNNVFEVLATAGNTFLGGDDFDYRLVQYMAAHFQKQHGFSIENDPAIVGHLKQLAASLKHTLSEQERAVVNVKKFAESSSGAAFDLHFQVERKTLNARFEGIVEQTFRVCDEALRAARLKPEEIDGVVLVGGSTRMPIVREMVEKYFNRPPMVDINPDEVVAVGAAIQGYLISNDSLSRTSGSHSDALLLDVTPMSLGIRTVSGFFDVLIERNSTVPYEQTARFTTTSDNQNTVRIQIYQGEARLAESNQKLGELELYGLPPRPRGEVQIDVSFALDVNGVLEVKAQDVATGIAQAARLRVDAAHSVEDIREMKRGSAVS